MALDRLDVAFQMSIAHRARRPFAVRMRGRSPWAEELDCTAPRAVRALVEPGRAGARRSKDGGSSRSRRSPRARTQVERRLGERGPAGISKRGRRSHPHHSGSDTRGVQALQAEKTSGSPVSSARTRARGRALFQHRSRNTILLSLLCAARARRPMSLRQYLLAKKLRPPPAGTPPSTAALQRGGRRR